MSEFAEIRAMLSDHGRSLGRIEGTLAEFMGGARADRGQREELDRRMRRVEQRQHWYAGFGAAFGALVSALVTLRTGA